MDHLINYLIKRAERFEKILRYAGALIGENSKYEIVIKNKELEKEGIGMFIFGKNEHDEKNVIVKKINEKLGDYYSSSLKNKKKLKISIDEKGIILSIGF